MLKRFNRIRNPLLIASDQDGASISFDRSDTFKNLSVKHEGQLKGSSKVTDELQR